MSQPLFLLHFCVFVEDFLHGVRLLFDAPFVVPGAGDEEDGGDAYEDEARGVGILENGVVPDDRLDGGRGKFADEGGDNVVPEADGAQGAERVQERTRHVRHHACDEHDGEAVLAAVGVDLFEPRVLGDQLFC